nr:type II toxin-antitoxin system RelE/ParE family toxin [Synechococcus sp. CBW1107]
MGQAIATDLDDIEDLRCAGSLKGLRRLRVGNDRIVDELQRSELVILVLRIGHRREVVR